MIKRIRLNIPVTESELNAQGIADGTSQLVIELDASEPIAAILDILARVFDSGAAIAAVFINPFVAVRIASIQSTVLAGFDSVLMRPDGLLAALQTPCEQLIIFAVNESQMVQLRIRLDSIEPSWWHISRQNLIGALTHTKDLINPVVVYESTNYILDILGDEEMIRRIFGYVN